MGSGSTPRVDGHRDSSEPPSGQNLGQQPAEGVPDDRWLLGQLPDDLVEVIGYLLHCLVGEDLGMGIGFLDGLGIVRPARSEGGETCCLEDRGPSVPAAW
jgi:hypothetical protein